MLASVTCGLIFATVLALYLVYRRKYGYWTRVRAVPSGRSSIFSGSVLDFLTLKTHFGYHLKTIYDEPKFANESVVGVYGLYKPSLLVRDPQLLKSIFVKDFDCFAQRFTQPDLMLHAARNPYWKEMKTKLMPFFSSDKLKQMYSLIQTVGNNLEGHLKARGKRFVAEIKDIGCLFTVDVSATTIFGFQTNSLKNPQETFNTEVRSLVEVAWLRTLNNLCISFIPKLCGALGVLGVQSFPKESKDFVQYTLTQKMVERERTGLIRNDLIDVFVKLKEETQVAGGDMVTFMEGIYAQAAAFLIGGYETSSSAISHTLMELAKQPELLEKLRAEILDAFVAEADGQISYEAINKLEYLDMVVHETMRLYPLVTYLERLYLTPKGRERPYTLRPHYDFTLPEEMPIYISVYGLHYDERYWPNPKKFDPERFSPVNRPKIQPMTYIPFGEGPRSCIGSRLGMLQVKVGLVYFLKNHLVRVCDQSVMKPEFDPKSMVAQIKGGIYLEVVRDDKCAKFDYGN